MVSITETRQEHQTIARTETETIKQPPLEIVWKNVILFAVLHILALDAITRIPQADWRTVVFGVIYGSIGGLGITAGGHRLWAHRSYKARLPLKIFLVFCYTIAMQNRILVWVRDHRTHHKFSETDADPHNSNRGFFFAHMGWLLCKKRPEVKEKSKSTDLSDLRADSVVMFQERYYWVLALTNGFLVPLFLPWMLWGIPLLHTFLGCFALRLVCSLHSTWLVNSAAHLYGNRPYNTRIGPRENRFVSFFAMGEGFHNYHHTFPWDYSTSEWGLKLNPTTGFLDVMAYLGLAYDLKTASPQTVEQCRKRTAEVSSCTS